MGAEAEAFEKEMKNRGSVSNDTLRYTVLEMLNRLKDIEHDIKETKEIIIQLTRDIERFSGPGI